MSEGHVSPDSSTDQGDPARAGHVTPDQLVFINGEGVSGEFTCIASALLTLSLSQLGAQSLIFPSSSLCIVVS
uniref:Uncharacterized protein n=1 Tax=Oryza punctata TaxID=4537 RepID=A0A0E0LNT1_ORYPU